MVCEKHKIRKRPNSCTDCAEEIGSVNNEILVEKVEVESIKEEMVSETPISTIGITGKIIKKSFLNDGDINIPSTINLDEYYESKAKEYVKQIEDIFHDKMIELKKEVAALFKIRYEHLDIPLTIFNLKMLDQISKDGWQLTHILTKDAARVSGLKDDSAIVKRIITPENKKTLDEWKEKIKGTK